MQSLKAHLSIWLAAAAIGALTLAGCGKSESDVTTSNPPTTKPATAPLVQVVAIDWCKEHFMPESICVQCHPELADAFKKKSDWCAEHGVPDSQCFKHHPELKEKFAADFKAKNGKEPPTDNN